MSLNDTTKEAPYGYCQCGCGRPTKIAICNDDRHGWKKGHPVRFVNGHNNRRPARERFLNKVSKQGHDGCWLWMGAKTSSGYGKMRIDGRTVQTHRYSYELYYGAIPNGMFVMHSCDRTTCCNPAHLSLGTHSENMRDRDNKGRKPIGSKTGKAKLTEAQVAEIRCEYAKGTVTLETLSAQYGISQSSISMIVNRKRWRHIP